MVNVGVVFLSLGGTPELQQMTQNAIDSCLDGDTSINYEIVVYESVQGVEYKGARTIYPLDGDSFNYNRCMNICISLPMFDECKYIALCNNDLIFEKGWASTLIKKMKEANVWSACPMDPTTHADVKFENGMAKGRLVTKMPRHLAGWCIFQDLEIYKTLGALDCGATFWHSDTLYASQLAQHGLGHILVEDSKVHHLNGQTIGSSVIPDLLRKLYTTESPIHREVYGEGVK